MNLYNFNSLITIYNYGGIKELITVSDVSNQITGTSQRINEKHNHAVHMIKKENGTKTTDHATLWG